MKKLCLLVLSSLVFSSCSSINSYSSLIKKMKTYSGETIMRNDYSNGFYSEEGFFLNNDQVTLYNNGFNTESETYIFIKLPNSTSVPNTYYCLFSLEHFSTSYKEVASFYIDNTYSHYTSITFTTFNGDASMLQSSQNLAESGVNLMLAAFDLWLSQEYNTSLKKIGMFPNF